MNQNEQEMSQLDNPIAEAEKESGEDFTTQLIASLVNGRFELSWRVHSFDGWGQSPRWGLCFNEDQLDNEIEKLRAEGRVFVVVKK